MTGNQFGFNSSVFPAITGSTLASLDPATQTILRYFSGILQINLGTDFATDAVACGFTNAHMNFVRDGYMVASAVSFPVAPTLQAQDYKFPLLSVYRLKRTFEQHSSMKVVIKSDYVINYILPPLSVFQYNTLYKYLQAVSDTLVQRTWQGYDPAYNGGEQVWKTANIAYATLEGDEYGSFLGQDGKTEFPSIRLNMSVMEESQFVESNYNSMTNAFIEVDHYDGYNLSIPVSNIADGYANPNLSLTTISVSSGSVLGGTMVQITGSGFENVIASGGSSYNVTLNGAPVSRLIVRSNTILLVVAGPGATTGTGNVVIKDSLGNIATLSGAWTYT